MRKARATLKPGDVVGERFELIEFLGIGAFGSVWLAQDSRSGKQCALKLSDKDALGAPLAEYRKHLDALVKEFGPLRLPAVGLPDEVDEIDGYVYQVSPYHEGFSNLGQVLADTGALHPRDALDILSRISEAVGVLHAKGVIHGDLKPANILIAGHGDREVRLIDFGMVQPVEAEDAVLVFGTYLYMHPQLAANTREIDASRAAKIALRAATVGPYIDLYAIGVVALELLTASPEIPYPLSHTSVAARLKERNPWLHLADDSSIGAVASLLAQLLTVRPREDAELASTTVSLSLSLVPLFPMDIPRASDLEARVVHETAPLPELTSAVYRIAHLGKLIAHETRAFVLKSGTIEAVADPKEDELLFSEVSSVFQHAIQRTRASWRLGVAMTIISFALLVSMIVSAVVLSAVTGEAKWAVIFGGASLSTVIGTLIWRPYDRLFRATILTQQIEIIHVQTVAGFRGTQSVDDRIRICREAVASLQCLFEPARAPKGTE